MWFDIGALMFLTGVFSMIVLLFQRVDNKMQRFWLFFALYNTMAEVDALVAAVDRVRKMF